MIRTFIIEKIQKRFSYTSEEECDEASSCLVPEDVKEGHFAIMAMKGSEKKRFVVKTECLNSPEFMRLLEKAEQEYGYEQTGALVVPCRPQELEKIILKI